jgi:hypothetical protein
VCADGSCWSTALQKGTIGRALNVQLPPELREQLAAGPASDLMTDNIQTTISDQGDMRGEK